MKWQNAQKFKYDKDELKKILSPLSYKVTQEEATEKPFDNKYYDFKEEGIYVDIVSGEPLFSSADKYDSGSGWPSFSKTINKQSIITKDDFKMIVPRTEIRSNLANSHLGHVFMDGPHPEKTRYCVNSAALKFIAKNDLEKMGYGEYLKLFEGSKINSKSMAILSGGCFWGMEFWFNKLGGVTKGTVGYTGGFTSNPRYDDVKTGNSGHAEALIIEFDNSKISYRQILEYFFKVHDPTTKNKQGNDIGSQYRSAIFYQVDEQKNIAEEVIKDVENKKHYKNKIVTEVVKFEKFYDAEEYHQDYLDKNPSGYNCHYIRY